MREAIINTSPVQYLYQLGSLHLLPMLFGQVIVPTAVREELCRGAEQGIALPDVSTIDWMAIREPSNPMLSRLPPDLDAGEREVLAIALECKTAQAILDDGLARQYARHLGIQCTGALGILLQAKELGEIPALRPMVNRLELLHFHLDPITRRTILELANE
ncbi:MAG: DUF3368 domain-containing protein [Candidatus Sumerlaeota bacterium]|nr:DUF3368 domain-containing protein [Candidatus Sumerlaeota bacterium]